MLTGHEILIFGEMLKPGVEVEGNGLITQVAVVDDVCTAITPSK